MQDSKLKNMNNMKNMKMKIYNNKDHEEYKNKNIDSFEN